MYSSCGDVVMELPSIILFIVSQNPGTGGWGGGGGGVNKGRRRWVTLVVHTVQVFNSITELPPPSYLLHSKRCDVPRSC